MKLELKSNLYICIGLCLFSIFIRYPFFNIPVISWDESTFILMGQDVLNGNLLYTNLWDLKPPLAFYLFSIFDFIADRSIERIRLLGALYIGLASFILYLCSKNYFERIWAIIASMLFTLCVSLDQGAVMTEHLALLPLVGLLAVFPYQKLTIKSAFYLGVLLAITAHIRLNLAFVAPAICLLVLFQSSNKVDLVKRIKYCTVVTVSFFFICVLIAMPHLLYGDMTEYLNSVYFAPLKYTLIQESFFIVFLRHAYRIALQALSGIGILNVLLYLFTFIGIRHFISVRKILDKKLSQFLVLVFVIAASVELSILKGGRVNYHYMLQLVPFLSIMSVFFASYYVNNKSSGNQQIKRMYLGGVFVVITIFSSSGYIINMNRSENKSADEYIVASYLLNNAHEDDKIYLMSGHIIYWLIGKEPIRPSITHPSNISKDYLFPYIAGAEENSDKEWAAIKSEQPTFIVKKEKIWYLGDEFETDLQDWLSHSYKKVFSSGPYITYKKTAIHAP